MGPKKKVLESFRDVLLYGSFLSVQQCQCFLLEYRFWLPTSVELVKVGHPGWSGKINVGPLECSGMFIAVGDN